VGDDTEEHDPAGREHDRVVAGQLCVEDEDRENDGRQPARANPTDKVR
jgi:hypothetical protein